MQLLWSGATGATQRRNGFLETTDSAIAKVQAGTDRTAAELALIRLDGDLKALIAEREKDTKETYATIDQMRKKRFVGLFWGTTFAAGPIGALICIPFFSSAASPGMLATIFGLFMVLLLVKFSRI